MGKNSLRDQGLINPQMLSKLPPGKTYWVEIRRRGVITESTTRVHNAEATLDAGVKGHAVGMILHKTESPTHIIVSDVQLLARVSDPEIIKPHHKPHFRSSKG